MSTNNYWPASQYAAPPGAVVGSGTGQANQPGAPGAPLHHPIHQPMQQPVSGGGILLMTLAGIGLFAGGGALIGYALAGTRVGALWGAVAGLAAPPIVAATRAARIP